MKKGYTRVQMKLAHDLLYFFIIFCILVVFCIGYIFIILVCSLQELMLVVYKFLVKHLKLLKEAVFGAH